MLQCGSGIFCLPYGDVTGAGSSCLVSRISAGERCSDARRQDAIVSAPDPAADERKSKQAMAVRPLPGYSGSVGDVGYSTRRTVRVPKGTRVLSNAG